MLVVDNIMLRVIVLVWFGSGCSWLTPLILFVHDLLQYIINAGATAATMGAGAAAVSNKYPSYPILSKFNIPETYP